MIDRHERTIRLIGTPGYNRIRASSVAVFGLGGVGSFCAEALVRCGVGQLIIVDHDVVGETNRNRQLHAMGSTLGKSKALVMAERLRDIDPLVDTVPLQCFFAADSADSLLKFPFSYVVDAIDSLGPKVELLAQCKARSIPVITVLGAGGKLDPTQIRVDDLANTHDDPMASRVRKLVRRRCSLEGIRAVYSAEPRRTNLEPGFAPMTSDLTRGRQRVVQPSAVMVPGAMGLAAAAEVIRALSILG